MNPPKPRLFHRNFTMVVIGQIISIFGNIILRFALSLYLLDVTGSALIFASISAVAMLPTIFLSPLGGAVADRVSKRDIMVVLDFVTAVLILGFGLLLREDRAIPMIGGVMVLLALVQAFYTPAVSASVPLLHKPENLVRANAVVNQVAMVASMAGPLLGGVVYGLWGIGPVIFFSGLCILCSAVLELFISILHTPRRMEGSAWSAIRADFSDSIRFIRWDRPAVARMMLLVAGINFAYSALILVGFPYMTRIRLSMGNELYGTAQGLVAAAGVAGGVITGLCAAHIREKQMLRMLLGLGVTLLPPALCFFLGAPAGPTGVVLIGCVMLSQVLATIFSIVAMSVIQQRTPEHLLGKVVAFMSTVSICATPLGQVLYGFLFDVSGDRAHWILLGGAVATALLGLASRRPLHSLMDLDASPAPPSPEPAG